MKAKKKDLESATVSLTKRQRITGKLFIPSIPFFTLILLNYAPCGQIH